MTILSQLNIRLQLPKLYTGRFVAVGSDWVERCLGAALDLLRVSAQHHHSLLVSLLISLEFQIRAYSQWVLANLAAVKNFSAAFGPLS